MGDPLDSFTADELTALADGLARLLTATLDAARDHGHPSAIDAQTASHAADQVEHAGRLLVAIDEYRDLPSPGLHAVTASAQCVREMCA